MQDVIVADTPVELVKELAKWARRNAASRLNNDACKFPRTATARRLIVEASTYNDVADYLDRLKIEPRPVER